MNIETQVVSLEIAQRLKALALEADSYFTWYQVADDQWLMVRTLPGKTISTPYVSAYTTDELIELLGDEFVLICQKSKGKFQAYSSPERLKIASADTPANALGLLLEEVLNERWGEH